MSQEVRNKIYTVVSGLFAIALIYGIVDQATVDQTLDVLDRLLNLAPLIVGLVTNAVAAWKSRPSKVTTLEIPKDVVDNVVSLTKTNGVEIAGPASPVADGTVLPKVA